MLGRRVETINYVQAGCRVPGQRLVQTRCGLRRMLWVRFDVPQRDADGDGPHEVAEVLEDYFEPAPDSA